MRDARINSSRDVQEIRGVASRQSTRPERGRILLAPFSHPRRVRERRRHARSRDRCLRYRATCCRVTIVLEWLVPVVRTATSSRRRCAQSVDPPDADMLRIFDVTRPARELVAIPRNGRVARSRKAAGASPAALCARPCSSLKSRRAKGAGYSTPGLRARRFAARYSPPERPRPVSPVRFDVSFACRNRSR